MSATGTRPAALELGAARGLWLVVRREFLNRVRTRAFVIGTVVLLVIIGGYVTFFAVLGANSDRSTVALTPATAALAEPVQAAARDIGQEIEIRQFPDDTAAVAAVQADEVDAAFTGGPGAYRLTGLSEVDSELSGAVQAAVTQQELGATLGPDRLAQLGDRSRVTVTELAPRAGDFGARIAIGLVSAGLLYFAILIYGQSVAQGVLEEKTSRVIELLLATVRAWQLMFGKIIGVGAAGLLQFAILGAIGVTAARVTGVIELPAATAGALAAGVLWFLLGFVLYATLYAAAGSLVSRTEDLQSVVTPITILVVVPFVVGFNVIDNPTSPLAVVLSLVPFFAPILMPLLVSLGAAAAWQVAVAVVLTIGAIVVLGLLGGRIYTNSVLRTGGRVKLRDALARAR